MPRASIEADETLVVPSPVLVEVEHLLRRVGRVAAFLSILDDVTAGAYVVEDVRAEDYRRVREICERYTASDIGFVDAAVLAITERLNEPKLATLDRPTSG